jgi:hypothetical protein
LFDRLLAVRTAAIGNGILIVANRVELRFGENNGLRGIGCGMFCWRFSPLLRSTHWTKIAPFNI